MWFESLTGFREESPDQVRANLVENGETIRSSVNGREMICGHLETPSLAELRSRIRTENLPQGKLRLSEVVGDVQQLHRNDRVFLTLLGGSAFGNSDAWILGAIERALRNFADVPLDVAVVSYRSSKPGVQELIQR